MISLNEFLSAKGNEAALKKTKNSVDAERELMDDVDTKNCYYDWFPKQTQYPDDRKPRISKGKMTLWWKCYKLLCMHGPMTKAEILEKLGLKTTSYSTEFSLLAHQHIIVPNKSTRKLEPQQIEYWKVVKVREPNGGYYWDYETV
jgi:hypothetical protein